MGLTHTILSHVPFGYLPIHELFRFPYAITADDRSYASPGGGYRHPRTPWMDPGHPAEETGRANERIGPGEPGWPGQAGGPVRPDLHYHSRHPGRRPRVQGSRGGPLGPTGGA